MHFTIIYVLCTLVFGCLFLALGVSLLHKETILKSNTPNALDGYMEKLEMDLYRSHIKISKEKFLVLQLLCPILFSLAALLVEDSPVTMVGGLALGGLVPKAALSYKRRREGQKFADSFVRALAQMASSLHAGMTVEQSVESVANCKLLSPSIRNDFKVILAKLKLGKPIASTFFEFAEMTGNSDVYDTATAISIMVDVGGDAGTAVEKIQKNIENRILYRKKRESMMMESKSLIYFADYVPLLIVAGTYLLMPDVILSYFKSPGLTLIFVSLMVVLFIGSVVTHRMYSDQMDIS